jgi:uncharacterized membrane protein YfcA
MKAMLLFALLAITFAVVSVQTVAPVSAEFLRILSFGFLACFAGATVLRFFEVAPHRRRISWPRVIASVGAAVVLAPFAGLIAGAFFLTLVPIAMFLPAFPLREHQLDPGASHHGTHGHLVSLRARRA